MKNDGKYNNIVEAIKQWVASNGEDTIVYKDVIYPNLLRLAHKIITKYSNNIENWYVNGREEMAREMVSHSSDLVLRNYDCNRNVLNLVYVTMKQHVQRTHMLACMQKRDPSKCMSIEAFNDDINDDDDGSFNYIEHISYVQYDQIRRNIYNDQEFLNYVFAWWDFNVNSIYGQNTKRNAIVRIIIDILRNPWKYDEHVSSESYSGYIQRRLQVSRELIRQVIARMAEKNKLLRARYELLGKIF